MARIYVIAHEYHLKRIKSHIVESDVICCIGRMKSPLLDELSCDIRRFAFFEGLSVIEKIFIRWWISFAVARLARSFRGREVLVFGGQDLVSWLILNKFGENACLVVDNLEFKLRPDMLPYERKLCFRVWIKALIYGVVFLMLNGKVRDFGGRFVYGVRGFKVYSELSFFRIAERDSYSNGVGDELVFISQPYYADYNISLDKWVSDIDVALSKMGCNLIKYHHRDSDAFRKLMRERGYTEESCAGGAALGIFSTLLFEYAVQGRTVVSVFESVKHLFPAYYVEFVLSVAEELDVCLKGDQVWVLDCKSLESFFMGVTRC